MQVKLYAGEESTIYETTGFDSLGRETDIFVEADSLSQANNRVRKSLKDYNMVEALPVSQKDLRKS